MREGVARQRGVEGGEQDVAARETRFATDDFGETDEEGDGVASGLAVDLIDAGDVRDRLAGVVGSRSGERSKRHVEVK